MDLSAAIAWLDRHIDLEKQSATAGKVAGLHLDHMHRLLHVLGDPHRQYPVVHVTGTNGKGSTSRIIAELLAAHGLRVGLYTSPHLQRITERLWWSGDPLLGVDRDGEPVANIGPREGGPIDDDDFAALVAELADAEPLAGVDASYFELLTAAAFLWFAQLPVDVAVVEVGLLGRFDATNVVESDVAVVTNIGSDHTDFGPGWREAIAREKAGIVKQGSFLVLGETDAELRPIFEDEARAAGNELEDGGLPLWVRGDDFDCDVNRTAVGGRLLDLRTPGGTLDELFLPLHGAHQGDNAALAVAAVEAFFARALDAEVVQAAFGAVHVPGRFEVLGRQPLVIVDGAHNPEGAVAAAETLEDDFTVAGRRILVLGILAGRDPDAMLDGFAARQADLVIACTPDSPRALPAAELAAVADTLGVPTEVVPDVAQAIERAKAVASPDDVILIGGSLYVAGAARDALGYEPGEATV